MRRVTGLMLAIALAGISACDLNRPAPYGKGDELPGADASPLSSSQDANAVLESASPAPQSPDSRASTAPRPEDLLPGERLIDDFAACSDAFETSIRTHWFAYDDQDHPGERACNHGGSTSTLTLLHEGYHASPCAMRWTVALSTKARFPFAGIGVGINFEMTPYRFLVMQVRGDGRKYRAKFPMREQFRHAQEEKCGNRNWNFYGQEFTCGSGTAAWTEVKIDLRHLSQEKDWPGGIPFDPAQVNTIEFQTAGPQASWFQCDIGMVKMVP